MTELPQARLQSLRQLLRRLGFIDTGDIQWEVLDLALVHPSLTAAANNDRLELLGDAVLRIVVMEFLYVTYPDLPVGELSTIRSNLISDGYLVELADLYGLDRFLALGPSAQQDPKGRARRLADAFEALLGALYLSWGATAIARLRQWLDPHLQQRTASVLADPIRHNAKAALQELTQGHSKALPTYLLVNSQEHPPWFEVEVWFQDQRWGSGAGSSKKAAETAAASAAYPVLRRVLEADVR